MRSWIYFTLVFTSTPSLFSQTLEQVSSIEEISADIKYLASDELEGRRTATPGNWLAAGYIAGDFAKNGVETLEGKFLHYFSYLKGVTAGTENFVSISSSSRGRVEIQARLFNPLGFSSDGSATGSLVFAGYGISASEKGYDDYAELDVAEKIVLVLRGSPDGDDFHGDLFSEGSFVKKIISAREKGAVGLIVVDLEGTYDTPMETRLRRSFYDCGIPVLSLAPSVFSVASFIAPIDLKRLAANIDSTRIPNSFLVKDLMVELSADIELERQEVPNVVGVVPGNHPVLSKEFVVIGGHFDHLGHGGEGSLDRSGERLIHNGADDNASGTAGVMALARHYAANRTNRRTLVFMAFNAEEEGLLGSSAIVESLPIPIENVVTMVNMDMVGRMSGGEFVVQGMGTALEWDSLVSGSNINGDTTHFKIKRVKDGYGPSDHSSFYAKEIPVLFFFTGLHDDYHRPSDDWDRVNVKGVRQLVSFVAQVIDRVDLMSDRPVWQDVPRTTPARGPRLRVVLGLFPDYGFDGKGLRLTGVSKGGPAEQAGLQSGDVIIQLGSFEVNNIQEYMYALAAVKEGDSLDVNFLRNGEKLETTVKPKKI